jgi:hypothetical protein
VNGTNTTAVPQTGKLGNVSADPLFKNGPGKDYALSLDSAARKAGAGPFLPLPPTTSWPLTEGEKAIIPDGVSRDYQAWKKPGK